MHLYDVMCCALNCDFTLPLWLSGKFIFFPNLSCSCHMVSLFSLMICASMEWSLCCTNFALFWFFLMSFLSLYPLLPYLKSWFANNACAVSLKSVKFCTDCTFSSWALDHSLSWLLTDSFIFLCCISVTLLFLCMCVKFKCNYWHRKKVRVYMCALIITDLNN